VGKVRTGKEKDVIEEEGGRMEARGVDYIESQRQQKVHSSRGDHKGAMQGADDGGPDECDDGK
jgi:hypothetical protein